MVDATNDDALPADPSFPAPAAAPSLPPFQSAVPGLPAGVPPLIPDDAELTRVLGGRPIPMRVGRPSPSPAPAAAAPDPGPAIKLSSTFAGAPAHPEIKDAVATVRAELGKAIGLIAHLETTLPPLLALLEADTEKAWLAESFDPREAREFLTHLSAALDTIRQ